MNIERLRSRHAESYRALMLDAYEQHPEAFTSSASERAALPSSWWEARLAEGPGAKEVVVGGLEGSRICGVAGVSFNTRQKVSHKATVFGMYVPAPYGGAGLGHSLLEAVLAEARVRTTVKIVQLTVTSGNSAAEGLYAKAGFVTFGTEPYAVAVADSYVSKVHMWREL